MVQYALPLHVFVCLDGEHVVFLDLKQDRYLAVEAARTAGLAGLVPGWPVSEPGPQQTPQADPIAKSLAAQGLLADARASGKHAAPIHITKPRASVLSEDYEDAPRLGIFTVVAFIWSALRAHLAVGNWKFERLIRRVERRNASRDEQFDAERARALVASFVYLRPFLFTSRDACLFESFALLEFLAWHGLHARWVFGVQARPFAAHCWVQCGDVVLNDSVERVSTYTPIMAV